MGVPLEEMMARLPEDRRRRVAARAAELVAEEMSLRALRKAMGKTQATVARKLGVKQENVSRLEQRTDMLLSTLNDYVRAAGGSLHLVAEFEGRPPVRLAGLAGLRASNEAPRVARGTRRAVARKPPAAVAAAAKKTAGAHAGKRMAPAAKTPSGGARAAAKRPPASRAKTGR
jgi:transcriptional regulator with XRE-family HTH domain